MTYAPGTEFISLGMMFVLIAFAATFIILLSWIKPRKTQHYRKELTDLYVAGKIRQYADKDKINLDKEYESFKIWNKKRKSEERDSNRSLDYNIESQMIDNLDEEIGKKTN